MKHQVPVEKGNVYELQIHTLGMSGAGVGRVEDFTVFVPGALPGETVRAAIDEVKKSYARGRVVELVKASRDRVEPPCPIYADCGGCQLMHMDYMAQLRAKRQQVIDAVTRIGKQKGVEVLPTLGAATPWNYRNKMQFPIGRDKGHTVIGCFAQGSHRIIDTTDCRIQREGNNAIVNAVRDIVEKLRIPVYNEDRHTGVLRHVVGRVGLDGDMVVLVTATEKLPHERELVKLLRARLPRVLSIHQNIQTYRNNVILGRETRLLWGRPTILDKIGRGTGTITLFLAQKARQVYGIEIVKPAIQDAKKNARDNGVKNAEFIVGDATAVMPRLYHQGIRADVVVVDPPRAGCTPVVLETFANMHPDRIVYVSCNPASLARDLAILDGLGYHAEKIQPVDMFPMTSHVESVALIRRKK